MSNLFDPEDIQPIEWMTQLNYTNPFSDRHRQLVRQLLDQTRQPRPSSYADIVERRNQQSTAYRGKARPLVYKYRERLSEQKSCTPADRKLYTDLVLFLLFFRYQEHFDQVIDAVMSGQSGDAVTFSLFREFQADARHQLAPFGEKSPEVEELPHIFACYFQIHRAFHYVTRSFAGYSPSMVKLRSDVWESIFTHDMERYKRSLFKRMQEIPTLITGPSGTGKELVARAIGLSRYIPFDEERTRFARPFDDGFYPINLTALSETLLESELFGHRKGSFTGALQDRVGFIERAGALGSVFLDEIGDVSLTTQVKLLRLLQSRIYQRLGDTTEYNYEGKFIAATNRELHQAMEEGQFREDFYYRLSADRIRTPSLAEQIRERPEVLNEMVHFLSVRVAGKSESHLVADETLAYLKNKIPPDYPWPGNVRELEQCIRNILIRKEYIPESMQSKESGLDQHLLNTNWTMIDLQQRYATLIYRRERSYEQAGKLLKVDPRTVKTHVKKFEESDS